MSGPDAAPVTLRAVHHIGITVADLDRSTAFYTALTGGEVLFSEPVREPHVAAHRALDEPDLDLGFAMIRIENTVAVPDIAAAHRRLTDAGIALVAEPYTFTAEDGAPDVVGATFAYFTDPDGLRLEILQPASSP